jgi:sarcosine oxidase subunit gamma
MTVFSLRAPRKLAASPRLGEALGITLPEKPNTSTECGPIRAVWAEPNMWLIFGPHDALNNLTQKLDASELGSQCLMSDLTGGRTTLEISGQHASEILATGCPIDLHPRAFATGQSARSLFREISIHLMKASETAYTVTCDRSVALTLWDMLVDAAQVAGLATASQARAAS